MKTEPNVNTKGAITFLASQRVNGRLVLVEADTRVDAMGGLLHRLVELNVIEGEFYSNEPRSNELRKNRTGATLEFDSVGEEFYSIPVAIAE